MIKRIVISLFFAWALGFPYAQAKMPHLLPYCIYRHYAVAGSAFMPLITNSEELLRQLDGMEMPFYVGYVKLERDPETRLVLSMDYSKKNGFTYLRYGSPAEQNHRNQTCEQIQPYR